MENSPPSPEICALLQALFEESSDAVFVKGLDGKYLLFNPAACRMVGKKREDVLGRDDRSIFDPASAQRVMERDRRVLESGQTETEEEVLTAAGLTRVYQATKAPYRDAQGKIVAVLGISRDITELKIARDTLAFKDHKLQETERIAQIGTWEIDLGSKQAVLSAQACQLFGVPVQPEPYDFQEIQSRIHPDDRALEAQILEQALRHRVPYCAEYRVVDDQGFVRSLRSLGDFEWDETGRASRARGLIQDITENRQALTALHQSERVLRLVLEALPVGVQVMDIQGNIVTTNPAAEKILGNIVTSGLERWTSVQAWWHDSGQPIKAGEWASSRALALGETSRNEVIDIKAFDGQRRTILNSGAPIRDELGAILGAVVINEDITERTRLQQQILQSQKMQAVGQLAAGAAHDFNNLLTVISGCSELLLEELETEPSKQELLQEIMTATGKAAAVTRQLLTFSRQSISTPKIVDLNQLIRSNQKLLARLISEEIRFNIDLDDSPCFVRVDPIQLEQALMNLCLNARDAMPTGGTLSIRSRQTADGKVAVTVSDSGEGMSKETRERIFEPFYTTKPQGRGTGLGLAVVYGIVEQSGGRIEVESTPGEGSCFKLFLPRVEAEPDAEGTDQGLTSSSSMPSESVLLVEDQEAVRSVVGLALERAGYQVLQAQNGLEALQVWDQNPDIQIVVTDIVMPQMSGRQLAEQIHKRAPQVKVLFMSGHHNDASFLSEFDPSQVDYLQKPFAIGGLTQKIRQLLDRTYA